MGCGKEDLSYFLITEVYKTHIVFPARRHGLVFGLGTTAEKKGPALGTTVKDMPWNTGHRPSQATGMSDDAVCDCCSSGGLCVPSFISFSLTDLQSPAQPAK